MSQSNLSLKGKNVFISGGSRGIGLAIAVALGKQGANVAIAAKTAEPHPKLKGTIYTAAKEIDATGGRGLPIICDIRFEEQVAKAIKATADTFGGIDILINNASAISMTNLENTSVKTFDLMNQINGRGTWLCSKIALPYLKESAAKGRNPHILTLSPPLDMRPHWFEPHVGYTMAKYAMSLCTLGLAGDLASYGIAVNSLWPQTAIDTAAMSNVISPNILGGKEEDQSVLKMRNTDIMADAAIVVLSQDARKYTGQFTIDEFVLRYQGVTDFTKYKMDPRSNDEELVPDFFLPENPWNFAPTPRQVLKNAKL